MGFKFAGTSPGNSAENYSTAVTDGYIDGPSYDSIVTGTSFCYFQTRAHTTEPMTGLLKCDGPSSGNRRVINEVYPTRPGGTLFQNQNV